MIDFVLEHIVVFAAGIIIGVLWTVCRNRRKAVDRLVDAVEEIGPNGVTAWPQRFPDQKDSLCGCRRWVKGYVSQQGQDAPGRVIARSVRRMMKEK